MRKEYLTWEEFDQMAIQIANDLRKKNIQFSNIYGIPRGGLILAVRLSHLLSKDLILNEKDNSKLSLIVDDISDSGRTLEHFKNNKKVTLYYKEGSIVIPDIWIKKKTVDWIVFPWEVDSNG